MNPRLGLLWVALALAQSGLSQIPQSARPVSDPNLPRETTGTEVPFKLYRNYLIVVQGSVGEFEGLNFLVDTGVNPTAVDGRIARKFPLLGGVHKLALLNQDADVTQVVLPSLRLGPILAKSLPAVIQDLSPFKEALGVRVDAIIGLGVLSFSFSIDYRKKRMVFGPVESLPTAVPFDTGPPVVTVRAEVEDKPVRLLVDSGAADLMLFECELRGRLLLPTSGVTRFRVNGSNTESGMREVWLAGLRLGATDLGLQKGLEAEGSANCGRSFDGVMGITGLGLKWIAFDFEHRSFVWKR